jgi:hypothetical protein
MILFGYERRESAIERYSELPLSTPLVHAVARLSLKKMAFHVVVALIGTVALLNASEKMNALRDVASNYDYNKDSDRRAPRAVSSRLALTIEADERGRLRPP